MVHVPLSCLIQKVYDLICMRHKLATSHWAPLRPHLSLRGALVQQKIAPQESTRWHDGIWSWSISSTGLAIRLYFTTDWLKRDCTPYLFCLRKGFLTGMPLVSSVGAHPLWVFRRIYLERWLQNQLAVSWFADEFMSSLANYQQISMVSNL